MSVCVCFRCSYLSIPSVSVSKWIDTFLGIMLKPDNTIYYTHSCWVLTSLFVVIFFPVSFYRFTWPFYCPLDWGCTIHRLHLCRCPGYDTKQSDGEVQVMLELWEMLSTLSLPSLPGPLWLGAVSPDRALSMSQIELNWVFMLNWIVWDGTVLWH